MTRIESVEFGRGTLKERFISPTLSLVDLLNEHQVVKLALKIDVTTSQIDYSQLQFAEPMAGVRYESTKWQLFYILTNWCLQLKHSGSTTDRVVLGLHVVGSKLSITIES